MRLSWKLTWLKFMGRRVSRCLWTAGLASSMSVLELSTAEKVGCMRRCQEQMRSVHHTYCC